MIQGFVISKSIKEHGIQPISRAPILLPFFRNNTDNTEKRSVKRIIQIIENATYSAVTYASKL